MMRALPLLLLLLLSPLATAQYREYFPPAHESDAPVWLRLTVDEHPNLARIDSAFEAWQRGRPYTRNEYTQYYKRFRHWAERQVSVDGAVRVPTPEEQRATEGRLRAERASHAKRGAGMTPWTFLGPKRTLSTGAEQTTVTWQTNIYSLDQSVSDPNILFAGGETGGIWRSGDRGATWAQVSKGLLHGSVRPIVIDPSNPSVVYAGTDGRLVRSSDGGGSWSVVYAESGLWTHDMLVCSTDPRVVCAATTKGFLRSSDGGSTWTRIFPSECWTVAEQPGAGHAVYTVRDSGNTSLFCRSADNGATFISGSPGWWQPAAHQQTYGVRLTVSASAPERVYALIGASASNPDDLHNYAGVFVSSDAGRTWRNCNPQNLVGDPYRVPAHTNLSAADGLAGLSQGFYDFAIIADPANADALVAGGTSWWRSSDAGATWQALGGYAGGLPWAHPDMQWLRARAGELWICSDGGINYSTDFALTHMPRMDGIGGSDFWGFDAGWNEDVFVGGRYHNGNTAFVEGYPDGTFLRMGGGEAATGYLHPDENRRAYFSDIGGYVLPKDPAAEPLPFSVGKWPNESYYHAEFSGMTFDPRCSGTVYIGHGNGVWKSTDAGASYALLRSFAFGPDSNAAIEHIAIPRCNPSVLYATQRSNVVWDGRIRRSTDAGVTWTECAPIPGTTGGERRVVAMDASGNDDRELWVALRAGSAKNKVFKSTDGGASWINLTTATIAQGAPSAIVHQLGTDGGVYLATTPGGLYYRNNSMSDWTPYADGLPVSIGTRLLRPFYRDGKLRTGSDMGIWETALYEASKPLAQISVNRMHSACARDTFYFCDRSVLRYGANPTWSWSFPGASHVSSTTGRSARVVYSTPGTYDVSLTIRENGVADTQTLPALITVESGGCAPDTVPGFAASLGGNDDPGLVEVPPLGIATNRFTFSAWVKPDGIQPSFASVFSGNKVDLDFDGDNELHYYWPPNGRWWVSTGLRVPPGEWSHVAMVATPDSITVYVNGLGWTARHANDSVRFLSGLLLGNYNQWGGRYFKGAIDEVCIFDRALPREEIRERMHLTRRNPGAASASDSGLVAYYQFNERDGGATDRIATRHAQMVGSAVRVPSNGPFGGGTSARGIVASAGAHGFPEAGVTMTFPSAGTQPGGEVVISRIALVPDALPANAAGSRCYWIADNYGRNASFSPPDSIRFAGFGPITPFEAGDPRIYALYTRPANANGGVWGASIDRGDGASAGGDGSVLFSKGNRVSRFGQFFITKEGTPTGTTSDEASVATWPHLYPTVLRAGDRLTVSAAQSDRCMLLLSNAAGQLVLKREAQSGERIDTDGLPAGAYSWWLRAAGRMRSGMLVIR
jgi:PKD repeat protein/photosystem II stability/assembly factor-like uncharacterized protein